MNAQPHSSSFICSMTASLSSILSLKVSQIEEINASHSELVTRDYPSQGLVNSDSRDTLNRDTVCRLVIYIISMSGSHEYIIVHSEKLTVGTLWHR